MTSTDTQLADKNIVDRTKKTPNQAMSNAIKQKREQLQSKTPAHNSYDHEILSLHNQNTLQSAAIGPMMVILTTIVSFYFHKNFAVFGWAIITSSVYALLTLYARRLSKLNIQEVDPTIWRRRFNLIYTILGVSWASFACLNINIFNGQIFDISQAFDIPTAAILIIVIASSTLSTYALNKSAFVINAPILLALIAIAISTNSMTDILHAGFQIIAAGFFILIAGKLYQSTVLTLNHQTEKDALIAELEVANSLSYEARRRAEEANLAKSRFLASMSHELRTPLNAILGFSEIMKDGVMGKLDNKLYQEYVEDIHGSGQHLLSLINEILDLSRIEAGRYELNEESISLSDIASDCIAMVQLKARSKHITLVEMFEPDMPMVWADEKAIRQVVLNLLSNAVKFTPHSGEVKIKLGWTAGHGQYLSVVDNGQGIPEDEIPVVLSAFGQGSIAIKSAEQGTGLGLPIVQAIMKKHEGNFMLKSKLRVGTTAICTFPAKRIMQSISPTQQQAVQTQKQRLGSR